MLEMKNTYTILVGIYQGKTPLTRCRSIWQVTIKSVHGLLGLKGVDWIHLPQRSYHCPYLASEQDNAFSESIKGGIS
jgi:hypothetical protein